MTIITKIVKFCTETKFEQIPWEMKQLAKTALTDYVAVTCAGCKTQEAGALRTLVTSRRPGGQCRLIGCHGSAAMEDAALINGMAAHILDYDDAGLAGHPSAVLYSAALAAGESYGSSGREILRAYILAYEVSLQIADLLMPELTDRGWHGTSVFGVLGAAAAGSILAGLDQTAFSSALGLAASRAGGLMINFGTSAKPYHAGMAASDGLHCVLLAEAGFTASASAIEGRDGYAQVFAGKEVCASQVQFGEDWNLFRQDLLIKRYPCCSAAHTALDAILELKSELRLQAEEVARIEVGVPAFTLKNLLYPHPETVMQARFSMHFALALAIAEGPPDLCSFSVENLYDSRIRSLMGKITMNAGEAFAGCAYIDNEPAVVRLWTKDGRLHEKRVDFAAGTAQNPISEEALYAKFDCCIGAALGADRKKALYHLLKTLEEQRDMTALSQYL